jgi:hypothetical protein
MAVSIREFVKANLVLMVGLALPIVLMAGFLVASALPQHVGEPPKYSLVFATTDFSPSSQGIPVSVRLVVRDGVLHAQYVRTPQPNMYASNAWKKLYLYDASSRRVRELSFGLPSDISAIDGSRDEIVDATRGLKLDTTLRAPDGYELAYGRSSRSGLLNEIFWGGGATPEPRLDHGNSSYPLPIAQGAYFSPEFIGWVIASS